MTVLVTGATGTVGSSVVSGLLDRGTGVRALVRDAQRARAVLDPTVEIVVLPSTTGTPDAAPHALHAALEDVDAVFLACGNTPGQVPFERAVVRAAGAGGAGRLVKLSGPDPRPDSPVLVERWHAAIERTLALADLRWAVLRPCTFMTNLLWLAGAVASSGVLPVPAAGARVAFVDPYDVAAVAVELLVREELPDGEVHPVTGPAAVSYAEVAAALSAATGTDVTYVPVSEDQARAHLLGTGMDPGLVELVLAVYARQRDGALAGVSSTVRDVTGREPRGISSFTQDHRDAFRAPLSAGLP